MTEDRFDSEDEWMRERMLCTIQMYIAEAKEELRHINSELELLEMKQKAGEAVHSFALKDARIAHSQPEPPPDSLLSRAGKVLLCTGSVYADATMLSLAHAAVCDYKFAPSCSRSRFPSQLASAYDDY